MTPALPVLGHIARERDCPDFFGPRMLVVNVQGPCEQCECYAVLVWSAFVAVVATDP